MKEGRLRQLLSKERIDIRISELAEQINRDYEGKEVFMVVILKGSVFFACDLARRLTMPLTMDFMGLSSYEGEMYSTGKVTITKELDEDISGKHVLVVEDVVDSGTTLFYLKNLLLARSPESLQVVTLLDKPARRMEEVEADYIGFDIPNQFVVGYGLDYAQEYRNLPYIAVFESFD